MKTPSESDATPQAPDWADLSTRLRRAARALTRSDDHAADLVQQTFVRLLSRAPEHVGNVAYARRVMLRLWLDEQRSLKRRMTRIVSRSLTQARWHVDADTVETSERLAAIHQAIDALPPRQRAAIVLRLIEQLDYDHIADAMGCDVGNVRSLLHAARARIRDDIGGSS